MSCIITIEGNIGVGKSTILNFLKKKFNKLNISDIIFLQEPVNEWEKVKVNNITILEKFYEEPEKYAFSFQLMAFISRLVILQKAIKKNPNAIIISERCLLTDKYVFAQMLYDTGKIDSYSFQIYNLWFNYFFDKLPQHKHIYLSSSSDLITNRINNRKRSGEDKIDIHYLAKCNNYHNTFFDKNSNLLANINIDNIELFSNNLNDPQNENYNNLINNITGIIINNSKSRESIIYLIFKKIIRQLLLTLLASMLVCCVAIFLEIYLEI